MYNWYNHSGGVFEVDKRGGVQYYGPCPYSLESLTMNVSSQRNLAYSRANGPSEVHPSGILTFEKEGAFHREDGPAMYHPNMGVYFYIKGSLFTEGDFLARKVQICL